MRRHDGPRVGGVLGTLAAVEALRAEVAALRVLVVSLQKLVPGGPLQTPPTLPGPPAVMVVEVQGAQHVCAASMDPDNDEKAVQETPIPQAPSRERSTEAVLAVEKLQQKLFDATSRAADLQGLLEDSVVSDRARMVIEQIIHEEMGKAVGLAVELDGLGVSPR